MDWSAAKQQVLEPQELPTPGTIIAMDAEFVALQQVRENIHGRWNYADPNIFRKSLNSAPMEPRRCLSHPR